MQVTITFTPEEWVLLNDILITVFHDGLDGYSMNDIGRLLETLKAQNDTR